MRGFETSQDARFRFVCGALIQFSSSIDAAAAVAAKRIKRAWPSRSCSASDTFGRVEIENLSNS